MRAMKEQHLDPARTIIAFLGGVHRVREITGSHISNIYRWMMPRDKRGTGGKVPYETADQLLDYAKENGVDLRGDDFFDAARLQKLLADQESAA